MRCSSLLPTACIALAALTASRTATGQTIPLTVEKIYAHGPLIGEPPKDLQWSPDGSHLTYMDSGELIDLDPGTGKSHVLISRAKLAPLLGAPSGDEQDKDHRARYGEASYIWAPDSRHLLFDASGRLWLFDLSTSIGLQIGFTGAGSGDDPKFSPDGSSVSYIRNHSLAVLHLREPGTPTTVVAPAPDATILNGEVDWVYEEELAVRTNYHWAPDSKGLAFLQMNESEVPVYPLTDWIPMHARVVGQRYPQPADANPTVRVGAVMADGGRIFWVKLPMADGQDYIPRFGWLDRKTLWIETLTRDQKHRAIYFADLAEGTTRKMLEIKDEKFLEDEYDVTAANGSIVLMNWSDGHTHIYLYKYDQGHPLGGDATLERQLTKGDFDVAKIERVELGSKAVDYASNEGNPLEQQVWEVNFNGERRQVTKAPGFHEATFAPHGDGFVDRASTRMTAPLLSLCGTAEGCHVFWETRALEPYGLRPPEPLEVKAQDGTTLYATLLLPAGATTAASVPLIVNPYGGPGPQEVANRWGDALLFDELLAEHGFAVLHADNRGTGMRGRDFAQAAYHNFGPVQLEDQLTVVDAALAKYPQLDAKRLGWWGWSWGGTFTLYAMTHSDRFRAGVSVAPVTDWRNYDSIYTERYMSLPADFPDGYKDMSVVNAAAKLHGRLLLVHGTGDDNVHMENSIQFIQALIEAEKPYDLQLYPRKTHSIAGPDVRTHLYNRILAQFETYLMPPVQ